MKRSLGVVTFAGAMAATSAFAQAPELTLTRYHSANNKPITELLSQIQVKPEQVKHRPARKKGPALLTGDAVHSTMTVNGPRDIGKLAAFPIATK